MKILDSIEIHWRNGITDIDVRKVPSGYQVIDSCREVLTKDGTGINQTFKRLDEAKAIQIGYAKWLKRKI
jgi:hypothetical protein